MTSNTPNTSFAALPNRKTPIDQNATMTAGLRGGDPEKAWLKILSGYRKPVVSRSLYELAITFIPFVVLWAAAWAAIHFDYWIGLILVLPAAGFLLRLFMLQHDCGHGSLFARRRWDDWTGRALGVLTLTPYDYWRRAHAEHHASAGNLDERGVGDITTLTVAEYRALTPRGKLGYRLYRHPLVMFGVGPAFLFLFKQRLPFGMMRSGALPWISTMATNAVVAAFAVLLVWAVGIVPFLLIHLPIVLIAGSAGVWLFYVQHQFEDTHWSRPPEWAFPHAAMHGASHYDLPGPLRWITGNIGMHHVHHLSSRVPFYRLPEVLRDYPELAGLGRISLRESLGCVKLVLWDETTQRLVSLCEAEARIQSRATADDPAHINQKDIIMDKLQDFAASANGDRWLLEKDAASGKSFVLHKANLPSGGHETRIPVETFLSQTPSTPERDALLALLDTDGKPEENGERDDEKTPSLKLAEEYLRLGGSRRAKVDDNIVSTRKWEDEPAEAETFWKENIEAMDDKQRQEVEVHLPSISDD